MHRKDLLTRIFMSIISVSLILSMVACGDAVTSSNDEKEESSYSDVSKTEDSKEDICDESVGEIISEETEASEVLSQEESSVEEILFEDEEPEELPDSEFDKITYFYSCFPLEIDHEYSDGYAFVKLDDDKKNTYCIDKNGNVKFKLEGEYWVKCGFQNGYAFLEHSDDNSRYLCDENGKLVSPEDVGATDFVYDNKEERFAAMLADGYIMVKRETVTYTETFIEYGIMNTNWEMVIDYWNEETCVTNSFDGYRKGVLYYRYGGDKIAFFDIHNHDGLLNEDWNEFFVMTDSRQSDFWWCDDSCAFDHMDLELFNLDVHGSNVEFFDGYENGFAPVKLRIEDEVYFSEVDEENNLQFEPVCVGKHDSLAGYGVYYHGYDNGKYLVSYKNRDDDTLALFLFDETGLIKQYKMDGFYTVEGFSDERVVIGIKDVDDVFDSPKEYIVLTTDFEPAF